MKKPMLANKFCADKAKFPCFIQPKLDGVRCLHSNEETYTRNLKPHKRHIRDLLSAIDLPDGWTLDGELMLAHRQHTFQETVSAVKKHGVLSPYLEYHVYDVIAPDDIRFFARRTRVEMLGERNPGEFIVVPTMLCLSVTAFNDIAAHFIAEGYEGAMYRSPRGYYKHGRSGRDLLKYKEFQDDEYEIIGVNEGMGKDAGTPIFVCRTVGDKVFNCRPKGTYEWRHRAWDDRESLIGKTLTVRFQELTDGGIPRFPVGVEIRDYE